MENFTPLNIDKLKIDKKPKKNKTFIIGGFGLLLVLVLVIGFYINKTLITIQQKATGVGFKCDQPNQKWATDLDLIKDKGKVESGQGTPFFDPDGATFKIQVPKGYKVVSIGCYDCDHYGDKSDKGWKISWSGGSIDALTSNNTWKSWLVDIPGVNEILFDGGGDSHGGNACVALPSLVSPSPTPPEITPTESLTPPVEESGTPIPTPSEILTETPTPTLTGRPTSTPTLTRTPTPSPTSGPTATDTPGPSPTTGPSATPIPVACGTKACDDTTNPCRSGLNCVQANDGSNYCTFPEFQAACQANPTQESCCTTQDESPTPTEIVLVNATATPGQGAAAGGATEIPAVGVATFGKIFAVVSIAVILLGLIL